MVDYRSKLFVACTMLFIASFSSGQSVVTTVAGANLANHERGLSATFADLVAVAIDKKGDLYLSDSIHCQIRRLDKNGFVTLFAGGNVCGFAGDGGDAKGAQLRNPFAIAFAPDGSLLIADTGNARIRKVSPSGKITTVAGNGISGYSGDNGPATQASLRDPEGVFADNQGNIFIADSNNFVIRMVDASGVIHTVAGNGTQGFGTPGSGGLATTTAIGAPESVVADNQGDFFFTEDNNNIVQKVDSQGMISTFAGNGQIPYPGITGSGGPATAASITTPFGLLLSGETLYISTAMYVWSVDLNTNIATIIAGTGVQGYGGDGGPAISATFNEPWGMAVDSSGDLIVADSWNARARRISSSSQIVTTIAGGFLGDGGPALKAGLDVAFGGGIAFDGEGNLYIADSQNNRVRKVSTAGTITTIAGNGLTGYSGDNGPAVAASLADPTAVAFDGSGNMFIADAGNGVVRKVDASGNISTFARPGLIGLAALLPGLAVDGSGNVYVSDGIFDVWKIDPSGNTTLFAGAFFNTGYNGDGIPATEAELNFPAGLAVDGQGNVYIAEWLGNRVRKVDTSGIISTVAGTGVGGFNGDGISATAAQLFEPTDIAVDGEGNLYISDSINFRIRWVDGSGVIHTFAGTGSGAFNGDGLPAVQTNVSAINLALSPQGSVHFTDEGSFRIRKVETQ